MHQWLSLFAYFSPFSLYFSHSLFVFFSFCFLLNIIFILLILLLLSLFLYVGYSFVWGTCFFMNPWVLQRINRSFKGVPLFARIWMKKTWQNHMASFAKFLQLEPDQGWPGGCCIPSVMHGPLLDIWDGADLHSFQWLGCSAEPKHTMPKCKQNIHPSLWFNMMGRIIGAHQILPLVIDSLAMPTLGWLMWRFVDDPSCRIRRAESDDEPCYHFSYDQEGYQKHSLLLTN